MNNAEQSTEGLNRLFKVLSKQDALEVFLLAGEGIENSAYAIEELGFSQKKYYARLRELVEIGFITKIEGAYRQTAFGSIICGRLLPAMGRAYDARDRLGLIAKFKGTQIEDAVRKLIEDELKLPGFAGSNKVRMIDNYESMVIDVIDICDEAEKSILMGSNYMDVRVMESVLRAMERNVKNSFIVGKKSLSSKMQSLKMIPSLSFTKPIIDFYSKKMDLKDIVRIAELPHSFCIVDGYRNIIEIYNPLNEGFIVALSIDDKVIGERLTEFHNTLWDAGEFQSILKAFNSLKSN